MPDTPALEIERSLIGSLELEDATVSYVNLERQPAVPTRLRSGDAEYAYERSVPVRGHSAVLPGIIAELREQGRRVLVAERHERYIVYVA